MIHCFNFLWNFVDMTCNFFSIVSIIYLLIFVREIKLKTQDVKVRTSLHRCFSGWGLQFTQNYTSIGIRHGEFFKVDGVKSSTIDRQNVWQYLTSVSRHIYFEKISSTIPKRTIFVVFDQSLWHSVYFATLLYKRYFQLPSIQYCSVSKTLIIINEGH